MQDLPDKYKNQWVVEEPHCPLRDAVISMLLACWWIAGPPAALFAAGYFVIPYLAGLASLESKVTPMSGGAAVMFAYYLWPTMRRGMRR